MFHSKSKWNITAIHLVLVHFVLDLVWWGMEIRLRSLSSHNHNSFGIQSRLLFDSLKLMWTLSEAEWMNTDTHVLHISTPKATYAVGHLHHLLRRRLYPTSNLLCVSNPLIEYITSEEETIHRGRERITSSRSVPRPCFILHLRWSTKAPWSQKVGAWQQQQQRVC